MIKTSLLSALLISVCFAQALRLDSLDRLAAKAEETTNITLDAGLLKLASGFLSDDDDEDAAQIKKLVAGIRAINVRGFTFKSTGAYSDADLEPIRTQLKGPDWKRIVQVHSKTEGDSDVYVKASGKHFAGLVVLASEAKELTVINIDGDISPESLQKLAGNFGIPKSLKHMGEKK